MPNDHVEPGSLNVSELPERLQHLSQVEAGDLAKLLENKWRVVLEPWRVPHIIIADPMPPDYGNDKIRFNIVVTNIGPNRLVFIKEARAIMQLGVLELNALIKSGPLTVARSVKANEAAWMKRRIEYSGASAEIMPV